MQALMLTAGKGERLRPHTAILPKPAIPFLNVPMVGYPLFYLEQAGLKEIVFNTFHLPKKIEAVASELIQGRYPFHFSHESPEILGGGGGLVAALPHFQSSPETLMIVNGDSVTLFPEANILTKLVRVLEKTNALATLLVTDFPPASESFGGIYCDSDGRVRDISKTAVNDPSLTSYHFSGFLYGQKALWQGHETKPTNLIYEMLLPKIQAGALVNTVYAQSVATFETGNVRDYLSASGQCLSLLSQGGNLGLQCAKILSRFTPRWREGARLRNVTSRVLSLSPLDPDTVVEDFAVIGANVKLGKEIELKRCALGGHQDLSSESKLENVLLIGPDSYRL